MAFALSHSHSFKFRFRLPLLFLIPAISKAPVAELCSTGVVEAPRPGSPSLSHSTEASAQCPVLPAREKELLARGQRPSNQSAHGLIRAVVGSVSSICWVTSICWVSSPFRKTRKCRFLNILTLFRLFCCVNRKTSDWALQARNWCSL